MELWVGLLTGGLGEGGSRDAGRGRCRQGRCRGARAGVRGDDQVAPRGRAGVLDVEHWMRRRGPCGEGSRQVQCSERRRGRGGVGPGQRLLAW